MENENKGANNVLDKVVDEMIRLTDEVVELRRVLGAVLRKVEEQGKRGRPKKDRSEEADENAKNAKPKANKMSGSKGKSKKNADLPANVARFVHEYGSPVAIGEIVNSLGLPPNDVRIALKSAIAKGWLEMQGSRRLAKYASTGADVA